MAKSDWVEGQDRIPAPKTAGERVAETVQATPDADAATFAETNEVAIAAYANYADALNAHQEREDIETLADRRARENGTTFAAGDFMRAPAGDEAPTSGSVNGVAPSSGGGETEEEDDETP